jgi:hypothetical protein
MTLKIGWLHEAEQSLGTWLHEADDWQPRCVWASWDAPPSKSTRSLKARL